jgi:hypothetical protein
MAFPSHQPLHAHITAMEKFVSRLGTETDPDILRRLESVIATYARLYVK